MKKKEGTKKNEKEALDYIEKAIQCEPRNTFAWLQKGRLFLDIELNLTEALECFKKCIELDPYMFLAYHDIGLVWLKVFENKDNFDKEDYDKAYSNFQKSKEINPMYIDNNYRIAQLYLINKEYDNCIEYIERSFLNFKTKGLFDLRNQVIKEMKIIYEKAISQKYDN